MTVSIGISCYNENCESGVQLLSQADKALFSAKSTGKNKVVFYSDANEKSIVTKRDE